MMVTRQGLTAQRETVKWAELLGPVAVSLILTICGAAGSVYVSAQIQTEQIQTLKEKVKDHDAALESVNDKLDALLQSNARIEGFLRMAERGK